MLKSFGNLVCMDETLRIDHPANGKAFPTSRQVPLEIAFGAKDFQTCPARETVKIQVSHVLQIVFGRFMSPNRLKTREGHRAMCATPKFLGSLSAADPEGIKDFVLKP